MVLSAVNPCRACSTPTEELDVVYGRFPFCAKCKDEASDEMLKVRSLFFVLASRGVDPRMADRIMTERMRDLQRRGLVGPEALPEA